MTQVWCTMYQSYSKVSMIALRVLVPFASTYLCEAGFSTLVNIKTKNRNRLNVGDDVRLALTNVRPRISKLAAEMQHQASHWLGWIAIQTYVNIILRNICSFFEFRLDQCDLIC